MSLDVWLKFGESIPVRQAIFIRRDGKTVEISREEWDKDNPDREPVTCEVGGDNEVFFGNITHNLRCMAEAAGIYKPLWRPDENNITHAHQLIEPLTKGLEKLKSDPNWYKGYNAENGWGTYENLVEFVTNYRDACIMWPEATVHVWR